MSMLKIFRKKTVKTTISPSRKKAIDKAVKKTVKEYGKTLVLLGKE